MTQKELNNNIHLKYKIGISGAADTKYFTPDSLKKAEELGRLVASRGMVVITGATTGEPLWAAKGAKEAGGFVIGISPAHNEFEHVHSYGLPLEYHDIIMYCGFGYSLRNLTFVRSCDALLTVAGRIGTLNEFTDAFEDGKVQGVLDGSGGTTDLLKSILESAHRGQGKVVFDANPVSLLDKVVEMLEAEKRMIAEGEVPAIVQ